MINFSRLNNRIEILQLVTTHNAFGEQETAYKTQGAAWCSVEAKQTTRSNNNVTQNAVELVVRCRYSRDLASVTPLMAVKYDGNVYEIDSVIDKYQTKTELFITCHRVL